MKGEFGNKMAKLNQMQTTKSSATHFSISAVRTKVLDSRLCQGEGEVCYTIDVHTVA